MTENDNVENHNWVCSECNELNERIRTREQDHCDHCGVGLDTYTINLPSRVKVALVALLAIAILLAVIHKVLF